MAIDVDALLQPLPDPNNAEGDPRDGEIYTDLSTEVSKLASLTSDSLPNWARIEQLGADYLTNQSKDYLVSSWLAEAWTQRHDFEGVIAGLSLLSGLTERFWDSAIPPAKRLRGRRNAIAWWTDQVTAWIEKQSDVTIEAHISEQLLAAAHKLDALLAQNDPDGSSLLLLMNHIKRLPVQQAPSPSADAAESSALRADAHAPVPTTDASESTDSSTSIPSSPAANQNSAAGVATFTAPSGKIEINSPEDLANILRPVQSFVSHIGPALFTFDHLNPLSIQLTRFASRASISELPPVKNGITTIAPPPISILDAFEKISQSKNAEGMIEFCESRLREYPFWFDLDYQSVRGFAMMGPGSQPMRQAIIDLLITFLARLPDVAHFSFTDGTPFASPETLAWIHQCHQERSGNKEQDALSEIEGHARARVSEGKIDEAFDLLQTFIASDSSRRNQFKARLTMIEMALSHSPKADFLPMIEPLVESCVAQNLDEWEPALSARAWQLSARAAKQILNNPADEVTANSRQRAQQALDLALKHWSMVDFHAASRFAQ